MASGVMRRIERTARPANDSSIVGRFGMTGVFHVIRFIRDGLAFTACGRESRAVFGLRASCPTCRDCERVIQDGGGRV